MAAHLVLFRGAEAPLVKAKATTDNRRYFYFTIGNDALAGAQIYSGDRLAALYSSLYRHEDLIVVVACAVLIVRYAYLEPSGILRLESRNPEYPVLRDRIEKFAVKGVVINVSPGG